VGKQGQIVKKSIGKKGESTRPMMIALGGLINTHTNVILVELLAKYYILYHLFSFCKSIQNYIIHMDMEIIIFVGIQG